MHISKLVATFLDGTEWESVESTTWNGDEYITCSSWVSTDEKEIIEKPFFYIEDMAAYLSDRASVLVSLIIER